MSIITVSTPFNIDLEFQLAPFHKRLFAWALDLVIVYFYYYVCIKILGLFEINETVKYIIIYLFIVLPALLYHLALEVLLNGQSVGKKALGIKVMDISGNEATLSQYILRWMFRLVDMATTFGVGAVISAAVSKNAQRLGDFAAGTIVIDQKSNAGIQQTIYLEIVDKNYVPVFPQVMRISDKDINGIRNLLDTKLQARDSDHYTIEVADRIKKYLGIETDLHAYDLLHQLLQDYNYLSRK